MARDGRTAPPAIYVDDSIGLAGHIANMFRVQDVIRCSPWDRTCRPRIVRDFWPISESRYAHFITSAFASSSYVLHITLLMFCVRPGGKQSYTSFASTKPANPKHTYRVIFTCLFKYIVWEYPDLLRRKTIKLLVIEVIFKVTGKVEGIEPIRSTALWIHQSVIRVAPFTTMTSDAAEGVRSVSCILL